MNTLNNLIKSLVLIKNTDRIGELVDIDSNGNAIVKYYTYDGSIDFYECTKHDLEILK